MSFNTCPIATVEAPIEQVWRLLADPAQYAEWWDAKTRSIIPAGSAHTGQARHNQQECCEGASLLADASRPRERRGWNNVVQPHVVRELASDPRDRARDQAPSQFASSSETRRQT